MIFRIVRITTFLIPLFPIGIALYTHSMRPLGYLVWFVIGAFAHSIAEVNKSKLSENL